MDYGKGAQTRPVQSYGIPLDRDLANGAVIDLPQMGMGGLETAPDHPGYAAAMRRVREAIDVELGRLRADAKQGGVHGPDPLWQRLWFSRRMSPTCCRI